MSEEKTVTAKQQQVVNTVLHRHFSHRPWQVSFPARGRRDDAFVVQHEQIRLLVKFDANSALWTRLSAIHATPPIVGAGNSGNRSYVIQEFWEGTHPTRQWLKLHVVTLAQFVKNYHADNELRRLLSTESNVSSQAHLQNEVQRLENSVTTLENQTLLTDQFANAFSKFKQQSTHLEPFSLVPIHADPNSANIMVNAANEMTMVDWNDVKLSDPMRDIGLLLWWYLPQDAWEQFAEAYGSALQRDRMFWWVARQSLEIALYFAQREHTSMFEAFRDDFYGAVKHQTNPQVVEHNS